MIWSFSGVAGSGKDTAGKIVQYLYWTEGITENILPLEDWLKWSDSTRRSASNWQIKKWADALRRVAHIFLPQYSLEYLYTDEFKQSVIEGWDREVQQTGCTICERAKDHDTPGYHCVSAEYCLNPITVSKQITGRQLLQWLGTDAIRNGLHKDAWVMALMSEYKRTVRFNPVSEPKRLADGWEYEVQLHKDGIVEAEIESNWILTDTRFPNELEAVKKAGGITIRLNRQTQSNAGLHESETALDNATFDYTIQNDGTLEDLRGHLQNILKSVKDERQRA